MALLNFANLDFDQIKETLTQYIKSNSNFTDYDFEGSNLSTIIDVLAYNTYITSYNANMVSNEVFIDSATLRENVVALARNIGYLPRSRKASRTNISFFVDVTNLGVSPSSLTLKSGPVVSSGNQFGDESFVFGITEDKTVSVKDGFAEFFDCPVFEGTNVTQSFEVDLLNLDQKFILTNSGIDIDTLVVNVASNRGSSVSVTYSRQDDLFNPTTGKTVTGTSNIYFIQEVADERYELIFGDGVFGRKLNQGDVITVNYITTNAETANGISNFNFSGQLAYTMDGTTSTVTSGISLVTTDAPSTGGEPIESVDSIRKFAPQVYSTQNRALTANDYEILIPNKIFPETESISVFGGEELVPPQFGKVFISIKPRTGDFVSNAIKQNIKRDLKKYAVAGIVPEILDLKYLFIETESKVYYNTNLAPNASFVSTVVQNNINKYAQSSELNRYGARFKYSKFLKIIDQGHQSITSNITTIEIRRDLRLALNSFAEYAIDFGNEFHIKSMLGYNIKTSAFKVADINENVFLFDVPFSDKKTGNLNLFSLPSDNGSTPIIRRRNIGTVDYKKGRITLNPINITSGKEKKGQQILEISACPESNDVIGLQDLYLQLDRSSVEMIVDEISSGLDPSGSNYTVSPSYNPERIVRN
tara:strand:+ start:3899 stop:5836 length:1938 start_codon:yes stop_codon:yes gene_type:complete